MRHLGIWHIQILAFSIRSHKIFKQLSVSFGSHITIACKTCKFIKSSIISYVFQSLIKIITSRENEVVLFLWLHLRGNWTANKLHSHSSDLLGYIREADNTIAVTMSKLYLASVARQSQGCTKLYVCFITSYQSINRGRSPENTNHSERISTRHLKSFYLPVHI